MTYRKGGFPKWSSVDRSVRLNHMGKPLFLTASRNKFILKRIILPIIIVHFTLSLAATLRNSYIPKEKYAAILISDYAITKYDYWVSPLALIGAYPYWTYYFNNRGLKVRWTLRAYAHHLADAIKDPRCQSIVLVGHGSFNSWQAVDSLVTNKEVLQMIQGLPKKSGEWIQLTCAVKDFWPIRMGELVMNKENVYTYDDSVNTFYFVTDAIFGFKLIKSKYIHENSLVRVEEKE